MPTDLVFAISRLRRICQVRIVRGDSGSIQHCWDGLALTLLRMVHWSRR